MDTFVKIINPGVVDVGNVKPAQVFCKIDWNGKRLSITGVEGPTPNGNASGGCGQITDSLLKLVHLNEGWTDDLVHQLHEVWKHWHLNDMRAGCEHQRAAGWDKRPIDPSKPTRTYGKHFEGQTQSSWNLLGWVTEKEHPEGLLSKPCPECGYKYGTAWLREDVPTDVLEFLAALPNTERTPAWV